MLISNLVSNETARAMYVRMFFGTFGRLPSRTQGKKPADIFETYLTALWRGSSWEVVRAWVWHNFRPLAEALLRGMRLRSGKSRYVCLQCLELIHSIYYPALILSLFIKMSDPYICKVWRNDNARKPGHGIRLSSKYMCCHTFPL